MLSGSFQPRQWMGSCEKFEDGDWVLVGMPYDGTTSNRPGARFGPAAVREASWGLETYSPLQDKDLENVSFFDAGEMEFPLGNRLETLRNIRFAAEEVLQSRKRWFGIGGEHLVTLPVIEAYLGRYPNLAVIHFDAHADLRDEYLGERLSHATVMRRIADKIGPDRLVQIGIRSGPREEFDWMKSARTLIQDRGELPDAFHKLSGRPVFLTIDLDVLDPSILPGTGTPEPGGMSFQELMSWLLSFQSTYFVGADVVELAPHYDPSGVSAAVAAKVIREVLLLAN